MLLLAYISLIFLISFPLSVSLCSPQALSTIRDRMEEGSKDFLAAAEARGEKLDEISTEFRDRVAIAYENTLLTADGFLTGILGEDYKSYFPKGFEGKKKNPAL